MRGSTHSTGSPCSSRVLAWHAPKLCPSSCAMHVASPAAPRLIHAPRHLRGILSFRRLWDRASGGERSARARYRRRTRARRVPPSPSRAVPERERVGLSFIPEVPAQRRVRRHHVEVVRALVVALRERARHRLLVPPAVAAVGARVGRVDHARRDVPTRCSSRPTSSTKNAFTAAIVAFTYSYAPAKPNAASHVPLPHGPRCSSARHVPITSTDFCPRRYVENVSLARPPSSRRAAPRAPRSPRRGASAEPRRTSRARRRPRPRRPRSTRATCRSSRAGAAARTRAAAARRLLLARLARAQAPDRRLAEEEGPVDRDAVDRQRARADRALARAPTATAFAYGGRGRGGRRRSRSCASSRPRRVRGRRDGRHVGEAVEPPLERAR